MRECTSHSRSMNSRITNGRSYPTKYYFLLLPLAISFNGNAQATQIIIKETLASRKNTSPQNIYETNQLYTIGALKVVCVALQCVGFDEALYTEVLEKAEACKKSGRWRVVGAGVGQVGGVWSVGVNPSQNLVGLGSHTASGVGGTKSPIVESPVIKDGEDAVTSPSVTLAHGIPLGGPVVEKMAKGI